MPSMLMTKKAFVEYYPMGVIGIIVPWVCDDMLCHAQHVYLPPSGLITAP